MEKVAVPGLFPSYEQVQARLTERLPQYTVRPMWGLGKGVLVKKSPYVAALVRLNDKKKLIAVSDTFGSPWGVLVTGGLLFWMILRPRMAAVRKDVTAAVSELYG